jgi:tetratricopeptide (TPR) repeat protein
VVGRFRAFLRRSRTARVLAGLVLIIALGFTTYRLGWHFWAEHQLQAAAEALNQGQVSEARAHLLQCLQVRPRQPEIHLLLGRIARRSGNYPEAAEHLTEAARLGGVPEQIQLEWQLQGVQRGDLVNVENELWGYVEKGHPDRLDILDALARGYLATYRLDRAREALDRLLELQPLNAPAWMMRGRAVYYMRGYVEAEKNYARAVELAPDDREARLLLAACRLENARPADALVEYDHLLKQAPHDPVVLLGRAGCLTDLGHDDAAGQTLELLLTIAPRDVEGLTQLGKLHLRRLDPSGAEGWLRKAVELEPAHRAAVYNLSLSLQQQGKKDEAGRYLAQLQRIDAEQTRLAVLTKEIMASPHDAALRCRAGEIFLGIGNEPEGLRWLYSALQEDPNHRETHRVLRDYFQRQGREDRARIHERALARS